MNTRASLKQVKRKKKSNCHASLVLQSVITTGNAVVAHPLVGEEMKDNFRLLSQRWNDVSGGVVERQRALKAASHHYGEFKGSLILVKICIHKNVSLFNVILVLTAQECDWQDKLEKKLMRSTTLAADAEEISEELDVCIECQRPQH